MSQIDFTSATPIIPAGGQSLQDDSTSGSHIHAIAISTVLNLPTNATTKTKFGLKCLLRSLLEDQLFWYELITLDSIELRYTFTDSKQWINLAVVKSVFPGKTRAAALKYGVCVSSNPMTYGNQEIATIQVPNGVSTQIFPTPSNLDQAKVLFSHSAGVRAVLIVNFRIHGAVEQPIESTSLPSACYL